MDDEQRRKWRINREVSAGDLIAITVAIVAVLSSYFSLDKRVAVVELLSTQNHSVVTQTVQDVKVEVRRLADKIERYTEARR